MTETSNRDLLLGTIEDRRERVTQHDQLRFAFYGRVSTDDRRGLQDAVVSRAWQHKRASDLLPPHGKIVVEFFDEGVSRTVPLLRRPKGRELLDVISSGEANFDALIVGEAKRTFSGHQLEDVIHRLNAAGIELWVPEVGGRYDDSNNNHRFTLSIDGLLGRNESEVVRGRVRDGMTAIAESEDKRWLGGNPPYGYKIIVLDPKANNAKGFTTTLAVNDETAPTLRRIFDSFISGKSLRTIASELTTEKIPSPSGREHWTVGSLSTIIGNQVYTGYRVFGKQRKVQIPYDKDDLRMGMMTARSRRSTPPALSRVPVFPPLISPETFVRARDLRKSKEVGNHSQEKSTTTRKSVVPLQGRVWCEGRKMEVDRISKSGNIRFRLRTNGTRTSVATVLEKQLELTVQNWLLRIYTPETIEGLLKSLSSGDEQNHTLTLLTKQRKEKALSSDRLLTLVEHGHEDAITRFEQRQAEIRELDRQISEVQRRVFNKDDAYRLLTLLEGRMKEVLGSASPKRLKALYEAMNLQVRYIPEKGSVALYISPTGVDGTGGGNSRCPWGVIDYSPQPQEIIREVPLVA